MVGVARCPNGTNLPSQINIGALVVQVKQPAGVWRQSQLVVISLVAPLRHHARQDAIIEQLILLS
jgi:hypothetical protein